jgi:hypothetical protein
MARSLTGTVSTLCVLSCARRLARLRQRRVRKRAASISAMDVALAGSGSQLAAGAERYDAVGHPRSERVDCHRRIDSA